MGVHLGSRDLLQFWEISANISETVPNRHIVTMEYIIRNHKCSIEWHQYRRLQVTLNVTLAVSTPF